MNRKIIISLISLATSAALIFFFVMPTWSSIKSLRSETVQLEQEVVNLEELLAGTQQLEEKYQQVEEEAKKIFMAVPQEEELPHLLVQFDALAASNGLLLESITFNPVNIGSKKENSSLKKLSIDLSINGSYGAFKNYLIALENNIRSMDVNLISFTPYKISERFDVSANDIFDFVLGVTVYYQ